MELHLDSPVTDVMAAKAEGGFDAVFVAVGAQVGKRAYVPAGESAKILMPAIAAARHGRPAGAPGWGGG